MKSIPTFTALIEKEDNMYVALCTELDVATQGDTMEEAKANLHEAIELFFYHASNQEVEKRRTLSLWHLHN
jgi:predicted RNase H-like HicB family nuclease